MILFLIINTLLLVLSFFLSNSRTYNKFSGSALNPVQFVAFLSLFFIFDFYYLYDSKVIDIFEYAFVVADDDILNGFFAYTVFNVVFFVVVLFVTIFYFPKSKSSKVLVISKDVSSKVFWGLVLFLLILILYNFKLFIEMFTGETTRQLAFSGNQFVHIFFTLLIPSFAIYCAAYQHDFYRIVVAFLVSVFFISLSGSRGDLILLLIVVSFVFSFRVKKVSSIFLLACTPLVAIMLLVTRYYFREAWRYNSIFDFVNDMGGYGHVFFSTAEISMAEVIVTISIWGTELIRYPFESFVGGIMFPLPRSIFTFKPIGSGGVLTDLLSPIRWELTRSEIVTTGYGDLIMQFGLIGGCLVFSVMCFYWCRVVISTLHSSSENIIFFTPFLLWWPYLFVRADIFNMFGSIWSFLLFCFLYYSVSKISFKK